MSSLQDEAQKRKERLAQLRQAGLKRKREDDKATAPAVESTDGGTLVADGKEAPARSAAVATEERRQELDEEEAQVSSRMRYRNYDPETKQGRLGFLDTPAAALDADTVENRALALQDAVRQQSRADAAAADEDQDEPMALDRLQPVEGRNADLKRELAKRLAKVKPLQDAMIRKFVRDKVVALRARGDARAAEVAEDGGDLAREVERREAEARRDTIDV